LSTTLFVERFQAKLQACTILIPTFVIKIVSYLALIRRSNGDEYHFMHILHAGEDQLRIKDLESFKIYSNAMRKQMLAFD
jgi:hypothetical protein